LVQKSCEDLAEWVSELKGIKVSKKFYKPHRLSSIDERLRQCGVPWPGNLDGFLIDPENDEVGAIFELRRTNAYSVKNHNLNTYFSEDFHGWEALKILRNQLDVPLYILTWSSKETIVKIQELQKITDVGLEYKRTDFLEKDQFVLWFQRLFDI